MHGSGQHQQPVDIPPRQYPKIGMGSDIERGGSTRTSSNNINDDKSKRKRRKKYRGASLIPTQIVCNAPTKSSSSGNVVELGVLLSAAVFCFYLLGFYESIQSLPAAPLGPSFLLGHNLNLAVDHERELKEPDFSKEMSDTELDQVLGDAAKVAPNSDHKPPPPAAKPVAVVIPPAKWPISLRQEDESTYDTIIHPGDAETVMKVPPFWCKPVHNNKLMPRETAMKIGSCAEPDKETGSLGRGDACPADERTIFVGIASYRDFECRSTVESIFLRAKNPNRVRVAVVDQIVNGEDALCNAPIEPCDMHPEQALCKYADQVDVYEMKAELSIGPVFARHIGYRMYRGEYYATQSDAHVTYTQNWDADIIAQMEDTHNDMAVLTTYLTDVQGSIDETTGSSLRHTRPIMCNTRYEGGEQGLHLRHGSQPERMPAIHGSPQLEPWWAAGYSFSRGHFVVNVPYDWLQPMIFQGEEMSIGIRGFTIGYDYYAPERSVCFHHYAVGKNARIRNKVHHFWENDNKYAGTGKRAMKRLLNIVHMNPEDSADSWDHTEEDIYGIGGVRGPEKFYQTFGIDVVNKTVENHLCRFVDAEGTMHTQFMQHLRKDGMGIDYDQIDYRFKDPAPNEK